MCVPPARGGLTDGNRNPPQPGHIIFPHLPLSQGHRHPSPRRPQSASPRVGSEHSVTTGCRTRVRHRSPQATNPRDIPGPKTITLQREKAMTLGYRIRQDTKRTQSRSPSPPGTRPTSLPGDEPPASARDFKMPIIILNLQLKPACSQPQGDSRSSYICDSDGQRRSPLRSGRTGPAVKGDVCPL